MQDRDYNLTILWATLKRDGLYKGFMKFLEMNVECEVKKEENMKVKEKRK